MLLLIQYSVHRYHHMHILRSCHYHQLTDHISSLGILDILDLIGVLEVVEVLLLPEI